MTEEGWRRVAMVLAVVLALLIGFGAAVVFLPRGGTGGATPTPTQIAGNSPTPTLPGETTQPPTEVPTELPSVTPSPSPSPTPIPTYPAATIQFIGLQLEGGPTAAARTIAFTSNGPGNLTVVAKVDTASSTANVCFRAGTQAATCKKESGTISFAGKATSASGSWTVTAIADASSATAPAIDLTITWPAKTPKVTLSNFRFDGTGGGDLVNGFTVVFKARGNGNLNVNMDTKSGHNWQWNVLSQDQTAGTNKSYPTSPDTAPKFNVTSPIVKNHQYRVTVQNESGNLGSSIPLSGTFSWV